MIITIVFILLCFHAQGGKGYARHITFERIVSNGSARPIIIDQYYCAHEHCTNQVILIFFFGIHFLEIHDSGSFTYKKVIIKMRINFIPLQEN
jgi:hypothetical protein